MNSRNKPVTPRDGKTLRVVIVARISGCSNQKDISREDQIDHAKKEVEQLFSGPVDYKIISTVGKGERVDRPELAEVESLLRSRNYDLLVLEDIGRLVRGTEAVKLFGIAVDCGTRVLAPHDCVDTAEESWEEDTISACRDHVGHNSHGSKRLKFKLTNRFVRTGAATAREIFGLIKPENAKTYDDWVKDPAATPLYQRWFEMLLGDPNCTAVADWLNREGVRPGKYSRRKSWDGKMVRRVTANPILKGKARRGLLHTVKHHESGRRVSVRNPSGPVYWACPHLAHVSEELFDRVNALLVTRNASRGRKPVNGLDPLWRVPRKRSRFPGQHAQCWYCGRRFVWGGNGVRDSLMCTGARTHRCWHSVSFSGPLLVRRIFDAIWEQLDRLEGFDTQFQKIVQQACSSKSAPPEAWTELAKQETAIAQEKENLAAAMASYGPKPFIESKLRELEAAAAALTSKRYVLESAKNNMLKIPESVSQLREFVTKAFDELAHDSLELGALLRRLVPEVYVHAVRLCDGGHLLPRARVKLALSGIFQPTGANADLEAILTHHLTIDLFTPPQREQIRVEAVELVSAGHAQWEVARRLGVKPPVVSRALALQKRITDSGVDLPYIALMEPPNDYPKFRHHLSPKYQFEPVEGYLRSAI